MVLVLVSLPIATARPAEPEKRPAPKPVGLDYYPHVYSGRVMLINEEVIIIKPEGDLRTMPTSFHPDGTVKEQRLYVQDNTKPPKTFTFSDELLLHNGTLPAARRVGLHVSAPTGQHKISEVRSGDFVFINSWRGKGIEYCTSIQIQRRPGGKVPPAHWDDKTTYKYRIDTQMNAEQAREEMMIATLRRLKVLAP